MTEDTDSALRTVTQGAGLVLLGTVLQLGIAFFAKLIMARFLEVNEYGLVTLGIITINIGSTLALVGLDTGVARYLPRYDDETTKRQVVSFSYLVTVAVSVALAVGLFVFADPISRVVFREPGLSSVLQIMAIGIPAWTLVDLGVGVTRGEERTLPRILSKNIALPLSRFTLVAVALALGFGSLGVAGAYVGAYVVAALLVTVVVVRRLRPVVPSLTESVRDLLSFSYPLTFSGVSSFVYGNIDIFLLGFFVSATAVGVYNVVYPLAALLKVGKGAFSFLFVPAVSSLHADGQMDSARRLYQVTTKWLLVMVTPPFALMALFPEMTITVLFGNKYVDGSATLVVLAVGFFLVNVTGLNGSVLSSIGRSRIVMVSEVSAMAVNVVLNLLLIPEYGFFGAGVATVAAYLGRDLIHAVALYRLTGIHPFTSSIVRPALFTAVAVAVIYVPVVTFLRVTVPRLLVLFVLFLAIYAVSILRLGGIEREDVMMFDTIEEYAGIDLGFVRRTLRALMG